MQRPSRIAIVAVTALTAYSIGATSPVQAEGSGAPRHDSSPDSPSATSTEWVKLYGTTAADEASDIDRYRNDAIYIVGCTAGNLGGHQNAGEIDAFLMKLDSDGDVDWVRLIGTPEKDCANAVSVEQGAPPYRIYVAGYTEGSLDGSPSGGSQDAFAASFMNDGTPQFVTQLAEHRHDEAHDIVRGDSSVLVVGETWGPGLDGADNDGQQDYLRNQVGFIASLDDVHGFVKDVYLVGGPMSDYIRASHT
jgi:hypothetical protein